MIVSKQVQKALSYVQNIEVPAHENPWEKGRAFYEKFIPLAGEQEAIYHTEEHSLFFDNHNVALRVYRPNTDEKVPLLIYFHGGWFNAGSLETHDRPLRQLANITQATIVAVSYRLAPEYPFPEGLDDCLYATNWILENLSFLKINVSKIIIAGDSAGGALAATVTRKFKEKVSAQILIYPVTDNSLKTASWIEFQNGPILDLESAHQAWDWYLPEMTHRKNPDAVPILSENFDHLPPTFIAVAQYDPLKDEAMEYGEKLKTKNVSVELKLYKETIHGFFQMGGYIDEALVLMQDINQFIKVN